MSTISPVAVRRIHADLQQAGRQLHRRAGLRRPLGAKNAALSIMAGGEAEAFARAEPFFRAMGTTITHVGARRRPNRQAVQSADLRHQHPGDLRGAGAGPRLRRRSRSAAPVLLGGSAASWMLDKLGPAMIEGDVGAGFRIDLMLKDLRLVQEQPRR